MQWIQDQAAKWRHMFSGKPMRLLRFENNTRGGEQVPTSQALQLVCSHSGLRVVLPSRAIDAP